MKDSVFLTFCFMIVTALVSAHAAFKDAVTPVEEFNTVIHSLEKQRQEANLRTQISEFRLAEYQQQVATILPEALQSQPSKFDEKSYPLRQLASVTLRSDGIQIERASSLMEEGKAAFRDELHELAIKSFAKLISRFPDSRHRTEALFLLAESQYQTGNYQSAISTIERLMEMYPESELTGFALLRLGSIFEKQERIEDASDIYKAVLQHFDHKALEQQAMTSLKAVTL